MPGHGPKLAVLYANLKPLRAAHLLYAAHDGACVFPADDGITALQGGERAEGCKSCLESGKLRAAQCQAVRPGSLGLPGQVIYLLPMGIHTALGR